MAKRVRISDDGGSTWYTLPGNTAELSSEAGDIDDTVFGQDYSSTQTGLIGWTISANGLYKGFAGYVATIMKAGTSTTLTTEAMSLVSGKTYQITAAAKRALNHAVTTTVYDNAVAVNASNILSIDYLFGRVTFVSSYTPTGPITLTGAYFPLVAVGCSNAFTLTQTANAVDNTCMDVAKANDGHRTFEYGLKTVSLDLTGIYKPANDFLDLLKNRAELIIEINPDGNGKAVARGFFKAMNTGQSGDVGDLEQETITFNLSVPQNDNDVMPYPFHWLFAADATLSLAIQKSLAAWEAGELIDICYLPDGSTGVQGEAVITDLTLAGGLEVMNEFTVNVQGSDELSAYP